jgi:hypothetical protein
MRKHSELFAMAFIGGWIISACTSSEGTQAQPCLDDIQCPIGYECVMNYCVPAGFGEETGPGDGDPGDGDGDTGPGDGDGDTGPGDGDGDTGPGDGDGDGDGGDGDGEMGDGDGDTGPGDGDGDCQVGIEGCACDGGVCAPGLVCNEDYLCVPAECGDGFISDGEDCDGNDLDGTTCADLGWAGGQLACDPNSCQWDTSDCNDDPCGDGNVDIGEQCDGNNLNGFTCEDLGYNGGVLACDPVTCTYDASGCDIGGGICGNGIVEPGEQCDGNNLNGFTCQDLGYNGGQLFCIAQFCIFNEFGCF